MSRCNGIILQIQYKFKDEITLTTRLRRLILPISSALHLVVVSVSKISGAIFYDIRLRAQLFIFTSSTFYCRIH
jgi:hypothetical protein